MYKKDWSEYYEITKSKPPRSLLVKAFGYIANKNKAIDLGAGALRDTRYLLEHSFDVTVVDISPLVEKEAAIINSSMLHVFISSFEDFDFPKEEYDLASAMYTLSFTDPEHFNRVFKGIKNSLKKGGIFCGQFFGERDEWVADKKMTFHTGDEVQELLNDLEILVFEEEEKDDKTAKGEMKHWHVFHIIARK